MSNRGWIKKYIFDIDGWRELTTDNKLTLWIALIFIVIFIVFDGGWTILFLVLIVLGVLKVECKNEDIEELKRQIKDMREEYNIDELEKEKKKWRRNKDLDWGDE